MCLKLEPIDIDKKKTGAHAGKATIFTSTQKYQSKPIDKMHVTE